MDYLLVFAFAFAADWVWAAYIVYVSQRRAVLSSLFSGAIVGFSAYVTVAYMQDWKSVFFAVVGGMLGTFVFVVSGVDFNKPKE